MNFVMTGHKGLVGTFLLEKLISQGHKPVLLVDLRDGTNVLDLDKVKLTEKVDVFIHLAFFSKISKIISDPLITFNNSRAMEKAVEFCRVNKIPKIVYTSSSRVVSKEKNPYTASKIYGEELVKAYSQCYGIDYVIIRPSTVYGPFNDLTSRLTDVFILNALNDGELQITREKDSDLDFTYVEDLVRGILIAMDQKNDDFNISSGSSTKISYVADLIIKLAGKGRKVFLQPEITQPQHISLDISKIKKLGYAPQVSLDEGMKRTFDWYKAHLDEIKSTRKTP